MNDTRNGPWDDAMATFDVLAGGVLVMLAAWAWLVCDVRGDGACGCLLWLLPAGALLAGSGALLMDLSSEARAFALACKVASFVLLAYVAAAQFLDFGTPGWPGLAAAFVLAEAAALVRR